MIDFFYRLTKPLVFAMDAEQAHERVLAILAQAPRLWGHLGPGPAPASLAREVAGLRFGGPVGLAAGLDKDGVAVPFWPSLGFGFIEVGTVTPRPQPGNPRPRIFRIPQDAALINRMGFPNAGAEALRKRLAAVRSSGWPAVPIGVNVGKNKDTPLESAVSDYVDCISQLRGLADYFTVNVSSPNTPNLRELQNADYLRRLLPATVAAAAGTPTFLKLAPDLTPDAIQAAVDMAFESGIAGLIATNTTVSRSGLTGDPGEAGGLSGRPLWPIAVARVSDVLASAAGRLPVIGVGGIETAAQVHQLLDAGCAAVQIYSALIFQGPGLPARIHASLAD